MKKPALPPKTIWLYDSHIDYLRHDFFISKVTVVVDNICQWKLWCLKLKFCFKVVSSKPCHDGLFRRTFSSHRFLCVCDITRQLPNSALFHSVILEVKFSSYLKQEYNFGQLNRICEKLIISFSEKLFVFRYYFKNKTNNTLCKWT